MIDEKIREMVSDFGNTLNSFYTNPPSEKNNYHNWPLRFSGEEREMAYRIYYTFQKMTSENSGIVFHITPFCEEQILKEILSTNTHSQ